MPAQQVVGSLRKKMIIASVTPYKTLYARLSPGLLNSPAEVETTLAALRELR
jgi:selenocysteine lyase/cysteine desulfurase